jgi:hypothetical protein
MCNLIGSPVHITAASASPISFTPDQAPTHAVHHAEDSDNILAIAVLPYVSTHTRR